MLLLLVSFVAGILTVLAPCILPLLPVVVGGSVSGEKSFKKALTVTISLAVSVIVFTLLIKASTLLIDIPPNFWSWFSGGIIILFGLISLFPNLWDRLPFMAKLSAGSNKIMSEGYQKKSFWGDVVVGAALGPVFSTCSPTYFLVLAAVLPENFALGMLYLIAYAVGLSISLLIVSYLGQKLLGKVGSAANPKSWFKKILGLIFLIVGIGIITGFDKELQIKILDSGFFDVTKVEQKLLDKVNGGEMEKEKLPETSFRGTLTPEEKAMVYEKAPDLVNPKAYINTDGEEISLKDYVGDKVVLIDFWTYSCINCQRTTPYLKSWYEKYEDDGFVIIGVHTPEFAFEKLEKNVIAAMEEAGIEYPVVLDNDYETWRAYENRYWPRKYLIDIDGFIVYDHIGEGAYDETEKEIQKALKERAIRLGLEQKIEKDMAEPEDAIKVTGEVGSPEVYFGSKRNEYLANGERGVSGRQNLQLPIIFAQNALYLGGSWNITPEYSEGGASSKIVFRYDAKDVYMVASGDSTAVVEVYQDGVLIKTINIKEEKLYTLISDNDYGNHKLEIVVKQGVLKAFTFTFG